MTTRPDQVAATHSNNKSPWTDVDILRRYGNCKVLLIAPHGHPKNDGRTYSITKIAADTSGSYAIINKTYQKPPSQNGPNKKKKWVNLNRKNQVQQHLASEFEAPLLETVNEIISKFGSAIVIWIHGMKDEHLTPHNTDGNRRGIDALIGIGQGKPDRLTASTETVYKLIEALGANPVKPIKAALARRRSNFCGWHKNIMNQFFIDDYELDKVESIQIEIKKEGFRETENYAVTGEAIAKSIMEMTMQNPQKDKEQASLDNAVQKGTIQPIKASDIDFTDGQFKSRLDRIDSDSVQFNRLVESVKKDGILNNIIVRKCMGDNGKPYQLISGFRRMTALKASGNGSSDFDNATVMARILETSVSDDDAYRISFTENLSRQDLSLWEISKACAGIKERMLKSGKSKGEIEGNIAHLLQKNPRTVRRYLKLASIENEAIAESVHNGTINYLDALEIGEKDLDGGEIAALLGHLKINPKPTRAFKQFYCNIEYCCNLSGLDMASVLCCKNADGFLSLGNEELKARIKHLRDNTGKEYTDILKGKAGSLIKDAGEIDAGLIKKKAEEKFKEQNKEIVERVTQAFSKSNITGKFKIKPASVPGDNRVTVTITVPEDQMWQAFSAVSTANNSKDRKVFGKKESKTRPSKVVSPASNKSGKPESIQKDESKTMYRGSFEK